MAGDYEVSDYSTEANSGQSRYQQELEKHLGPMPKRPLSVEFGPLRFGASHASDTDYQNQMAIWQHGANTLAPKLLDAELTPTTVRQFSSITGLPPSTGASEDQYKNTTLTAPSQVPRYFMRTQPGQPLSNGPDVPRYSDAELLQQPGDFTRNSAAMKPGEQYQGPVQPDMLAPSVRGVEPRTPMLISQYGSLNPPSKGPLEEGQGPNIEYNKRELNLEAPINWPQRERMDAALKQQQSPWYGINRNMGGSNTYNTKVMGLADALMHSDPSMSREDAIAKANMDISGYGNRDSMASRREALTGQGQQKIHLAQQAQDMHYIMDQYKQKLMTAQTNLAAQRAKGDTPELRIKQHILELAQNKWNFAKNFIVATDKAGAYNEETHKLATDYLAEAAGIMGDTESQGFFNSLGQSIGAVPPPSVQRTNPSNPPLELPGAKPLPKKESPDVSTSQGQGKTPDLSDTEELRKATEEAMQDPVGFKGRKFITKSGKEYTFTGKGFE